MKSKIFPFIFGLPFLAVGAWMTIAIGSAVSDAMFMSNWSAVPAKVLKGGYERHAGGNADTYEAYVEYQYRYEGLDYRGDRVGIMSGADNIGDYQQNVGRKLANAKGAQVTVYVNPDDPQQSIYDPELRWAMVGIKGIFLLVFGGMGLRLIVSAMVTRNKETNENKSADLQPPWLANADWQGGAIRSNAKSSMYFAWGFAACWNLICAPVIFILPGEVLDEGNLAALMGLLFPVVGVGLIVWAVRRTREWRTFGPAPLLLDPFPGAIGGHVGGTLDVTLPYDARHQFVLTLTLLRSSVSGSGKNRKRSESAKWQETQTAHASFGGQGTRLTFRFDVPGGLEESDANKDGGTYYIWRLNLSANLPGADLDRDYEIPVYATGKVSTRLSDFAVEEALASSEALDTRMVSDVLNIAHTANGPAMIFPMLRNLSLGIGLMLFGGIFAGVGVFLWSQESEHFLGATFTVVGSLVCVFALYQLFNSLEVTASSGKIKSVRRWMGVPIKTTVMNRADFQQFKQKESFSSQSGGKHTVHYALDALDRRGNRLRVGEGFKGVNQVRAAALKIGEAFKLNTQSRPGLSKIDLDEYLSTN